MAEQRTYQGHVYTREAPGQPWTLAGPTGAPAGGTILRDPTMERTQSRQDNADKRAAEGLQMERERLRMSQSSQAQEQQARSLQMQKMQAELDAQKGADGELDDETKTYYAQQVLAGAPMPAMGMGKQAAANRQAVMAEVARMAGAKGLNGADLAAQIAHYKAGTKQIANLENMAGTIGVNEQTAMANGQQYIDRSAELPGQTSIAPLNAISNAIQRMFGGTTISQADAAYQTFTNEYAKVVAGSPSGAGTLSDSARHEAMSTISGSGSVAQKQAAFEQMKRDMANRMVAIHGGINQAYKALTGQPGYEVPGTTGGLAAAPNEHDQQQGGAIAFGGSSGGGGGSGPTNPYGYDPNQPHGDPRGTLTASTAQFINQDDPKVRGVVDKMIRAGKSGTEINAALQPYGYPGVQDADVRAAQDYLRKNPGYTGGFAQALRPVEQTASERAGNALGIGGSAAIGAYDGLNALSFGGIGAASDYLTGKPGQSELAANAAGQAHPIAKGVGEVIGTLPAFVGAEVGLGRLAARGIGGSKVAAFLANPLTADAASGAYIGAGSSPDNRLGGAVLGAVTGGVGGAGGRYVASPVAAALGRTGAGQAVGNAAREVANAGRRAFKLPEAAAQVIPAKPSVAEALLARTANKAGPDGVLDQLSQASSMGVPMALADTNRGFSTLAGAAVRRSPNAAQLAEDALIPRSRGQIDRLRNSVAENLGPIGNIPQLSADMTERARAAAGPLYDAAYAHPVPGTPELAATLETPFGRSALGRARTIAENERRSPTELGFAQDAEGNTILNPQPNRQIASHLAARAELDDAQNAYRMARNGTGDVNAARVRVEQAREGVRQAEQGLNTANDPMLPANGQNYTTQTLDYVKRGMDDVLEQQRNPITGRLQLDEAGRAQNQVRGQFLGEVDRNNPAYAEARAAYAGPVQARDAMTRGQDAYTLDPNTLGMQVANQSPEHLAQMQLGHRDAMMTSAEKLRYGSNPWDATLGTPAAEQRLSTLYPDKPQGVAQLLAQRDMERQLAGSTNDILGNSKTAQRGIADEAFAANPIVEGALHAGAAVATHGASIPGTAARIAGSGMRSRIADLLARNSVEKADAIAPLLLNTNPDASAAILRNLMDSSQAYQDYIRANNARLGGPFGVIGAGAGYGTGAVFSN